MLFGGYRFLKKSKSLSERISLIFLQPWEWAVIEWMKTFSLIQQYWASVIGLFHKVWQVYTVQDSMFAFKQPVKLKGNKGQEGEGLTAFISHANGETFFCVRGEETRMAWRGRTGQEWQRLEGFCQLSLKALSLLCNLCGEECNLQQSDRRRLLGSISKIPNWIFAPIVSDHFTAAQPGSLE